jgi:hypothetical protein
METEKDGFEPSPMERGDLLFAMKRYALAGFLANGVGSEEDFEMRWREALCADQPLKPLPHPAN